MRGWSSPLWAATVALLVGGCAQVVPVSAPSEGGTRGPCAAGHVLLTFDDGPTRDVTPAVLDTLAAKGAKATFFVTGEHVRDNPDLVRRAIAEGHRVGNHSWDHPDLATLSPEDAEAQLQRTNAEIQQATGQAPSEWRPPYGSTNPVVDAVAQRLGLTAMIPWDIAPGDAETQDPVPPETIRDRVLQEVRPDAIVLLHDAWTPNTPAALALILDGLTGQGYCTR